MAGGIGERADPLHLAAGDPVEGGSPQRSRAASAQSFKGDTSIPFADAPTRASEFERTGTHEYSIRSGFLYFIVKDQLLVLTFPASSLATIFAVFLPLESFGEV